MLHQYADDCQIYIATPVSDALPAIIRLQECLETCQGRNVREHAGGNVRGTCPEEMSGEHAGGNIREHAGAEMSGEHAGGNVWGTCRGNVRGTCRHKCRDMPAEMSGEHAGGNVLLLLLQGLSDVGGC